MNLSLLAISYFFHLGATVVWIGGMTLLVLVIQPLARLDERFEPLVDAIELKFRPLSNLSLLVLLMTGVVQTGSDQGYGGMLNFSTPWSRAILFKHIAFLGMVLIVAWLQLYLEPALERANMLARNQQDETRTTLRQRRERLIRANFLLGIIVLGFTAIATAY